jgi:putative ABC transport system permease protein
MSKLFGIPVSSLAQVLAVLVVLLLAVVVVLALRNRVFFRLGVRNAGRRRGRAALIVAGLMLATAIFTASLATGDTMSSSIRSSAIAALGRTDEVVGAKGLTQSLAVGTAGTGTRFFPQSYAGRIAAAGRASKLVDAVTPVIAWGAAVQNVTRGEYEPNVTLFAGDPATLPTFGPMRSGGKEVSLAQLGPNEVYLNAKAATALGARAGDVVRILAGTAVETARVRAVVDYQGAATSNYGVLMPLTRAQELLGKPHLVDAVFVANRGGVAATDRVVEALGPTVGALGLETDKTRLNALDTADSVGAAFVSFFTTFGSFSIAAGILLIVLIFVMLAGERRSELGIARAIGTRRGHLVQMFLYEGAAYDLVAALVGAVLGVLVAYAMVFALGGVFASIPGFHLAFAVKPASLVVAYTIGVLLTLAVLAYSAARVSRMNIVSAIRDLPDPVQKKRNRRQWIGTIALVVLGVLLAWSGVSGKNGITLGLGVSLLIFGLARLLRHLGLNERAVRTGAGLALIAWFVFPSISDHLFGRMTVNFSIFILGGLMIVIGATWTIMYNADALLGALGALFGRVKALAPVIRMSIAYPLRSLFRTGVTLAMFMLVVFTLVVGATTTGAFTSAFDNVDSFGGGFDVHATASSAAPVPDMAAAVRRSPTLRPLISVVASKSTLPVKARQLGTSDKAQSYLVGGLDHSFLTHTSFGLDTWARGYSSPADVWHALDTRPGLAVVDPFVVPRRANWGFGGSGLKFKLHGFYVEEKNWTPRRVSVLDPQTGKRTTLTVIGVLADSAPAGMTGIWTSQTTLTPVFGNRVLPTTHLFKLEPGVDPAATAKTLQKVFMANGLQADSMQKLLSDSIAASLVMDRLVEGFLALGLIVGVAALGVVTARAVVERRQQIGVLRAIGFQRRAVQASLLLESSFIALTAILVGTALGLVVAYNVIHSSAALYAASGTHLSFTVPWLTLGAIFLVVYLVALATTLVPARHAARVYPAEALRYQ